MDAPHLLGVVLKKHTVERLAEAVDVEVLERRLGTLVQHRGHIAATSLEGAPQAHVGKRLHRQLDGIVEELAQVEDAAHALTHQHHAVVAFGVGTLRLHGHGAVEQHVVVRRRALHGHHAAPPLCHTLALAEKAVTAHIHAVALVAHRLRNAAYGIARLAHHRMYRRAVEQLARSRQPRRASPNNQRHSTTVAVTMIHARLHPNKFFIITFIMQI